MFKNAKIKVLEELEICSKIRKLILKKLHYCYINPFMDVLKKLLGDFMIFILNIFLNFPKWNLSLIIIFIYF